MYVFSVAIWFNVCFMDISHDFFFFFPNERKTFLNSSGIVLQCQIQAALLTLGMSGSQLQQ